MSPSSVKSHRHQSVPLLSVSSLALVASISVPSITGGSRSLDDGVIARQSKGLSTRLTENDPRPPNPQTDSTKRTPPRHRTPAPRRATARARSNADLWRERALGTLRSLWRSSAFPRPASPSRRPGPAARPGRDLTAGCQDRRVEDGQARLAGPGAPARRTRLPAHTTGDQQIAAGRRPDLPQRNPCLGRPVARRSHRPSDRASQARPAEIRPRLPQLRLPRRIDLDQPTLFSGTRSGHSRRASQSRTILRQL